MTVGLDGEALKIWCKDHWQQYGPKCNPTVNSIVLTLMLTQIHLNHFHKAARTRLAGMPHRWYSETKRLMASTDQPACCIVGDEKMKLLAYAAQDDVLARSGNQRLDNIELLEAYLESLKEELQ